MEFNLGTELERLADLGYAPLVLYDDNGNWCIGDEGHGGMRLDDEDDFSFTVWGEAAWFKPSVELAWADYLLRLRKLGNDV